MAVAHYLDALAWQREVAKLHTIFGGKNPHPNFLVGGSPCGDQRACAGRAPARRPSTRSACRRSRTSSGRCATSSTRSMCPTRSPSPVSTRTGKTGYGEGTGNFLTYGDFPRRRHRRHQQLHGPARRDPQPRPWPHPRRSISTRKRRSRNSSRIPGTTTPAARTRDCTRIRARRSSTTPDPSRRMTTSTRRPAIPG